MVLSRQIGFVNFNEGLLRKDLNAINNLNFNNQYSEYFFGAWTSCPLWNKDGNNNDSTTYLYSGKAKETDYSHSLPYINNLIKTIFDITLLKSARIFSMLCDSFSIPHRDFLEIKENYLRIHIPLQTGEESYHSEEDKVFKMRKGEIWFLDSSNIHSVGYFSAGIRLHLVLDFEYQRNFSSIFKEKKHYIDSLPLVEVAREKMSDNFLNELYSLSDIIDDKTFFDVVKRLSKVHFTKEIHAAQLFQWLYEIIRRSKHHHLINKAKVLEESCLIKRVTGNLPSEIIREN